MLYITNSEKSGSVDLNDYFNKAETNKKFIDENELKEKALMRNEDLNIRGKRIYNIKIPIEPTDIIDKQYVDERLIGLENRLEDLAHEENRMRQLESEFNSFKTLKFFPFPNIKQKILSFTPNQYLVPKLIIGEGESIASILQIYIKKDGFFYNINSSIVEYDMMHKIPAFGLDLFETDENKLYFKFTGLLQNNYKDSNEKGTLKIHYVTIPK